MSYCLILFFQMDYSLVKGAQKVNFQVGYLLGLGDRHPSNLMLDRYRYIYRAILQLTVNMIQLFL
jgi:hypothetical protein